MNIEYTRIAEPTWSREVTFDVVRAEGQREYYTAEVTCRMGTHYHDSRGIHVQTEEPTDFTVFRITRVEDDADMPVVTCPGFIMAAIHNAIDIDMASNPETYYTSEHIGWRNA